MIETRNEEAGFIEFLNDDVATIVREIDAPCAILLDMNTRQVVGYRVYDPAPTNNLKAERTLTAEERVSDERLVEILAYTPTHADNKADRVWFRDLRLIVRELQNLRSQSLSTQQPMGEVRVKALEWILNENGFWRAELAGFSCEVYDDDDADKKKAAAQIRFESRILFSLTNNEPYLDTQSIRSQAAVSQPVAWRVEFVEDGVNVVHVVFDEPRGYYKECATPLYALHPNQEIGE